MSTIRKLAGKQYADLRDKRKGALEFYRQRAKLPGLLGQIGNLIYKDLLAIHRSSELNSPEKDREFKRYLQRTHTPAGSPAVGSEPGVLGTGVAGGLVPAREEVRELVAAPEEAATPRGLAPQA